MALATVVATPQKQVLVLRHHELKVSALLLLTFCHEDITVVLKVGPVLVTIRP